MWEGKVENGLSSEQMKRQSAVCFDVSGSPEHFIVGVIDILNNCLIRD
jgi:hypothetical protein